MIDQKNNIFIKIIALLVYIFLAAPIVIVMFASFSPTSYLSFPPEGFSIEWYKNIFNNNGFVEGFINSLMLASIATIIDIVIGISASIAVVKYNFKGKLFLTNFLTSPLFLPGITFGFVLLQIFSSLSGVPVIIKLLMGHVVIILPYIIRNVISVLMGFNFTLEEAALSLGASPFETFRKITLPLIKPGILAGALLAFLYSFDDVTISAFLVDHSFVTLPVRMLTYMEFAFDPTLAAISTILILFSLTAIILIEKFVGLKMFLND